MSFPKLSTMQQSKRRIVIPLIALLFLSLNSLQAQSVTIGSGSYTTVIPSGEVGPQTFTGANAIPKVAPDFNQQIQTNDFWSSLIYPFFGDSHSNILYAHPVSRQSNSDKIA